MRIYFQYYGDKPLTLSVNPTDFIENIKKKLKTQFHLCFDYFIFNNEKLDEGSTFQDYSIQENSIIILTLHLIAGGCATKFPSRVIGSQHKNDDYHIYTKPLPPGRLQLRYIRNTNSTFVYEQAGGTCYAYAACSAYINTILRIFKAKPPSFEECYKIACYNGKNGGRPEKSIRRLENHFQYGIQFDVKEELLIRDAITISIIVCFSTSKKGWRDVASGSLLRYPGGKANGNHAVLIEGYDLQKDCFICKNSWGGKTAKPRFDFTPTAAHHCRFIRVYFTENSILSNGARKFSPKMKIFLGNLRGVPIICALMNQMTAIYSSDYVCEYIHNRKGKYKYIGYDVQRWISINLNRPLFQAHSNYFYINEKIKKIELLRSQNPIKTIQSIKTNKSDNKVEIERKVDQNKKENDETERKVKKENDEIERKVKKENDETERKVKKENDKIERKVKKENDKIERKVKKLLFIILLTFAIVFVILTFYNDFFLFIL